MNILVWVLVGFASGSLSFSVWLVQRFVHQDIRRVVDGNPGAVNAWRAGGWRVGASALLLDFLKSALPVAAARYIGGVHGWELVPAVLAPVFGHGFSPLLNGHGGKPLAVTFGIWCGLTLYEAPLVLGFFMVLF